MALGAVIDKFNLFLNIRLKIDVILLHSFWVKAVSYARYSIVGI